MDQVMNNDQIVAIIPARYGSTRLPGKPLINLAGKSMVQHIYERTRRARLVKRVLVATDDHRVVDAVQQFGGEAVMTPSALASGSDRVAFVANSLIDATIIANVQGDEPLLEPEMIDQAIQVLIDDPTADVGTLVKWSESAEEFLNPNVVKVVLDQRRFALYFSRAPIPFHRDGRAFDGFYKHIGLYVYRREFLLTYASLPETDLERYERLEQLRILQHGFKIKVAVTDHDSIPVDTPDDVERVSARLEASIRTAHGSSHTR
jgi:3-deoxy-manno-octulosonate cytidylyltransferase (CMP-KDO synthetase)